MRNAPAPVPGMNPESKGLNLYPLPNNAVRVRTAGARPRRGSGKTGRP